jgi:L-fuconolactonase
METDSGVMRVFIKADSHIHLFKNGFFELSDTQDEVSQYELLRNLGGIDQALVIGYEGTARFDGNNSDILELARTRDWLNPVFYLNLRSVLKRDQLRRIRERGYAGFSIYLDAKGATLSNWSASALEDFGGEGSIISINAGPQSLFRERAQIAAMSSCTVLISHLGLPGPEHTKSLASVRERMQPLLELQRMKHVSVKLSGFYAVDPVYPHGGASRYVTELLECFGPSRLMWGSDFPPALGHDSAQQLVGLPNWLSEQLSPEEHEKITSLNLLRALDNTGQRARS